MTSFIKSQEYSSEYDSDSSSFVSYYSNDEDAETIQTVEEEEDEMGLQEEYLPDDYYAEEYVTEVGKTKTPEDTYPKIDISVPKINPWTKKENTSESLQNIPSFNMVDIVKSQMKEKENLEKMKKESAKKRAKFQFHSRPKSDIHKSLLLKTSTEHKTSNLKR